MANLSVRVNGLEFINPFIVGSGPPTTNKTTIIKAFKEGWGGAVAKTVSLDPSKVDNVSPRYGKLLSRENKEVIGFENIELISDRSMEDWVHDFSQIKREYPDRVLIASIMEEFNEDRWSKITKMCEEAGVDGFELNFSCPHGLPERKMGSAMGQNPQIAKEVTGWVRKATKLPIWVKMTPNVSDVTLPAEACMEAGADGISLINTILSVIGVNLKTLKPLPTVKGYSTPGGYSARAVKPIALRMVMEVAMKIKQSSYNNNVSVCGIGGVETGADACEFILMGAHTVQSCTGPMLQGFGMVKELQEGLSSFMDEHGFKSVDEFRGKALEYFTTHAHLAELKKGATNLGVSKDMDWSGDKLKEQTQSMVASKD